MGGPMKPQRGLSDIFGNPQSGLGGLGGLAGLGQQAQQGSGFRDQLDAMRYQQQMVIEQQRHEAEMREREMRAQAMLEIQAKVPPHIIETAMEAARDIMPKKPRHFVNYDTDLLPELRKWRDKWLEM